jgi:Ca2+-binding EF-hand superfamily protein
LTEVETTELLNRYRTTDGTLQINYRTFVNKLDEVFSDSVNPTEVIQNARTTAVSYRFFLIPKFK